MCSRFWIKFYKSISLEYVNGSSRYPACWLILVRSLMLYHHDSPGLRSRTSTLKFYVKVMLKVFRTAYSLNIWMDLDDTFLLLDIIPNICTIQTHLSDLEDKVKDIKFYGKVFISLYLKFLYLLNM